MKAHLVIDYSGRALSASLITAAGQVVPFSQEIRQIATRHVSQAILFEPRVAEHRDFIWEDALETLSKATPHDFFQRARRIGLRRPWDADLTADALPLASPLLALSFPAALAERAAGSTVKRFAGALLEALLEPLFTFVSERRLAFDVVGVMLVIPSATGRHARRTLYEIFRRHGFPRVTIIGRELAAALVLLEHGSEDCTVAEAAEDSLHLHHVRVDADGPCRQIRVIQSSTIKGQGWRYWSARIAAALHSTPTPAFDRSLFALLTGSPDSGSSITHGVLHDALNDGWIANEREQVGEDVQASCAEAILTGDLFMAEAVCRVFQASRACVSTPDTIIKRVAAATRWLQGELSRRLVFVPAGGLRVSTGSGQTVELLRQEDLPTAGAAMHYEMNFRVAGDAIADTSFLVHLMWGTDSLPQGNATLCAMQVALQRARDEELRLRIHLQRSRSGGLLHGIVESHSLRNAATARARFTQELEVRI